MLQHDWQTDICSLPFSVAAARWGRVTMETELCVCVCVSAREWNFLVSLSAKCVEECVRKRAELYDVARERTVRYSTFTECKFFCI